MCIRTGDSIDIFRDLDQMRFTFIIPISQNKWQMNENGGDVRVPFSGNWYIPYVLRKLRGIF